MYSSLTSSADNPVRNDDNEYKCITINNFFGDTNEIITKDSIENLDYTDTQLSPFPLGKRSKIRINDDFLKDLLKGINGAPLFLLMRPKIENLQTAKKSQG